MSQSTPPAAPLSMSMKKSENTPLQTHNVHPSASEPEFTITKTIKPVGLRSTKVPSSSSYSFSSSAFTPVVATHNLTTSSISSTITLGHNIGVKLQQRPILSPCQPCISNVQGKRKRKRRPTQGYCSIGTKRCCSIHDHHHPSYSSYIKIHGVLMSLLKQFISQECVAGPDNTVPATVLYHHFIPWWQQHKQPVSNSGILVYHLPNQQPSMKLFGTLIGFVPVCKSRMTHHNIHMYMGIGIRLNVDISNLVTTKGVDLEPLSIPQHNLSDHVSSPDANDIPSTETFHKQLVPAPSGVYTSDPLPPSLEPSPHSSPSLVPSIPTSLEKAVVAFGRLIDSCHSRLDCSIMDNDIPDTVSRSYASTTAHSLYTCFQPFFCNMSRSTSVFLDIGAGIGNCCIVAAKFFPVHRVIGIEYNQPHKDIFNEIVNNMHRKWTDSDTGKAENDKSHAKFINAEIEFIVGDIYNRQDLFTQATHCYSYNITWSDKIIKYILQRLSQSTDCTVQIIVWGVGPERISLLCPKFFTRSWCKVGKHRFRVSGSKQHHELFVYQKIDVSAFYPQKS